MREAAGQSIKSSVFHSWTRDTRDDSVLGTHGSYLKIFQEFAGLGGDASFYKAETSGQFSRPIIPGLVSHYPIHGFVHSKLNGFALLDRLVGSKNWLTLGIRQAHLVL